jgi:hypothetical protein
VPAYNGQFFANQEDVVLVTIKSVSLTPNRSLAYTH